MADLEPDDLTDRVFPEPEPTLIEDEAAHGELRPVDKFRRTTAGGVVAAGLLGIRDALEGRPEKEEVTIVSEAPARPEDGFTLLFDQDDPTNLRVVVPGPSASRAGDVSDGGAAAAADGAAADGAATDGTGADE